MKNIFILLAVFGFQQVFADVETIRWNHAYERNETYRWVLASDFSPTELANLSPQQEHELHLKTLSHKDPDIIMLDFGLELMVKSFGSEVFGFSADENQNRENNAIAKATFGSFAILHLQKRVLEVCERSILNAISSMIQPGNTISSAFSLACSMIDTDLKNESIYTTLRDKYKKQSLTPPKKTYLYGIPKSIEDLKKTLAELSNDPLMKKFSVHSTYSARFDDRVTHTSILDLANVPGKLESVEKMYDETVVEVEPLIKDVKPEEVDLRNSPVRLVNLEIQPILMEKMLSKIKKNPELSSLFESIRERNKKKELVFRENLLKT